MQFSRYAIYVTPPPGPFATFGAAWLGWDADSGEEPVRADVPNLPLARAAITEAPGNYGFHATIKPPFRLAVGRSEAELRDALVAFCARHAPVVLDGLELARLGRFLAVVPTGDQTSLNALAADTVRCLDPFRAAMTDAELSRRRKSRLTRAQEALLLEWGYPYVMNEFRFHLTLTGNLPKTHVEKVMAILMTVLAPLLPAPFVIDALSLMGESPDGRFHVLDRVPLTNSASQGSP